MRKIIQLLFAVSPFIALTFLTEPLIWKVNNLALSPIGCLAFAVLGTLLPKFFGMGVSDFKTANILIKLSPVVVVGIYLFGISLLPQTYATAFVTSLLIGNSASYIAFLISIKLIKKKKR